MIQNRFFKVSLLGKTRFWTALVVMIFLDQFSKWLIQDELEMVVNPGVSGGWLVQDSSSLLVWGSLIMLLFLWYLLFSVWQKYPFLSGIFFGAALSNIIDRILFGGVRDWLVIPVWGWKNNLADYGLTLMVGMIIYLEILKKPLWPKN